MLVFESAAPRKQLLPSADEATGAGLPQFAKDEFDAFLECGILAHGLKPPSGYQTILDKSLHLLQRVRRFVYPRTPGLSLHNAKLSAAAKLTHTR